MCILPECPFLTNLLPSLQACSAKTSSPPTRLAPVPSEVRAMAATDSQICSRCNGEGHRAAQCPKMPHPVLPLSILLVVFCAIGTVAVCFLCPWLGCATSEQGSTVPASTASWWGIQQRPAPNCSAGLWRRPARRRRARIRPATRGASPEQAPQLRVILGHRGLGASPAVSKAKPRVPRASGSQSIGCSALKRSGRRRPGLLYISDGSRIPASPSIIRAT